MPKINEYRGALRTLSVLRSLNRQNGATVTELSRSTKISRTALYRILAAIQSSGYVRKRTDDGAYFLTSQVYALSDGFKDEFWITEIAGPVLDDLQRRVVWPTDLGVLRGFSIKLASTTRRHSPLVIDRELVGLEMPLLRTALGMAYLAFSSQAERKAILDYFSKQSKTADGRIARDRDSVAKVLNDVRARGYSYRYGNLYEHKRYPDLIAGAKTSTIAVPILINDHSVASIGITFIASAMTIQQAVNSHLQDLKVAASNIEKQLMKVYPGRPSSPSGCELSPHA
jgi:IclR family mhp operon transcriptional activator